MGKPEESYVKLPLRSTALESNNPRSFTSIEIDFDNRFLYYSIAIKASILGFVHICHMVAVDSTVLKNIYDGI